MGYFSNEIVARTRFEEEIEIDGEAGAEVRRGNWD